MTVAVRVIPCLDVDGGRVVKGVNFRELRDAGDPVELAAFYDAEGADELTFLDITASSGGVSSLDDLRALASLAAIGVEGAIVGKALYAGAFTLEAALATVAAVAA